MIGVIAGTLQIPVGQQQPGDRAVVNGVIQIPVGQQQPGDRAVVNGVVQIPVGQQQPGDRAVNATNAQGGHIVGVRPTKLVLSKRPLLEAIRLRMYFIPNLAHIILMQLEPISIFNIRRVHLH